MLALSLTAVLLLHQQFLAFPEMRQALRESAEETDELKSIALWLRTNVKDNERIQMPESQEGLLRYYSERLPGEGKYIVSATANIPDAELVYDPTRHNIAIGNISTHYSVWRKK